MAEMLEPRTDAVRTGGRALSRRRLLATSAAVGVVTAAGAAPTQADEENTVAITVDVAVVGGGLSGLFAARRLLQADRTVVVLEASDRTGGRIQNGSIGGAVCELGAEWVASFQPHILALYKEFGFETFPTYTTGKTTYFYKDTVTRYEGSIPPLAVEDLAELAEAIVALDLMAATVPVDAPWKAPDAAAWDAQTIADWVDANIDRPDARAALDLIVGGVLSVPPHDVSLLHYLFLAATTGGVERFSAIKDGVLESRTVGGTGVIIEHLMAEVGDHVWLNAPVRLIDQSGPKVTITSDRGVVSADHVIVAVPPVMAGRISYEPPLPTLRDQLTQRAPMGWTIKCFAAYPSPFWREAGLNGFVTNPTPGSLLEGVFDNSPQSGTPGILYGWISGAEARVWGPRPAAERKTAVLEALATFFGDQALMPIDYLEHDWAASPWVRGCSSLVFGPGTWTEYGPALRPAVDRIHWAGTETAIEQWGSMDGAISAAERAVEEIVG